MAMKKENELLKTDESMEKSSSITYANEVVSTIAGLAAAEINGIAGMSTVTGGILGKGRNISKGVKVEIGTEEVSVDLYIIVEYGMPIQKAAMDAQENVRKAIESMTGLHVVRVDVHVQGVSFEKEKQSIEAGKETAVLSAGKSKKEETKTVTEEKEEPLHEETKAEEAVTETEKATDPIEVE